MFQKSSKNDKHCILFIADVKWIASQALLFHVLFDIYVTQCKYCNACEIKPRYFISVWEKWFNWIKYSKVWDQSSSFKIQNSNNFFVCFKIKQFRIISLFEVKKNKSILWLMLTFTVMKWSYGLVICNPWKETQTTRQHFPKMQIQFHYQSNQNFYAVLLCIVILFTSWDQVSENSVCSFQVILGEIPVLLLIIKKLSIKYLAKYKKGFNESGRKTCGRSYHLHSQIF